MSGGYILATVALVVAAHWLGWLTAKVRNAADVANKSGFWSREFGNGGPLTMQIVLEDKPAMARMKDRSAMPRSFGFSWKAVIGTTGTLNFTWWISRHRLCVYLLLFPAVREKNR